MIQALDAEMATPVHDDAPGSFGWHFDPQGKPWFGWCRLGPDDREAHQIATAVHLAALVVMYLLEVDSESPDPESRDRREQKLTAMADDLDDVLSDPWPPRLRRLLRVARDELLGPHDPTDSNLARELAGFFAEIDREHLDRCPPWVRVFFGQMLDLAGS